MEFNTGYIYIAQAISALFIMAVMYHYSRVYQRQYLKLLAFSFLSLCLYMLSAFVDSLLAEQQGGQNQSLITVNVLVLISCGHLQILFLLLSTRELVCQRTISMRSILLLMAACLLLAAFCTFYAANDPDAAALRYLLRIGVRHLAAGVAFVTVAVLIWRFSHQFSVGKRIVTLCFLFYGLEMIAIGALTTVYFLRSQSDYLILVVTYHGLFELLIYSMIGIGMVIWMLETERQRVRTSQKKLSYLNKTDALTGLANRQGLKRFLKQWQASAQDHQLQCVLLGVDGFQRINTADGIRRGDEVLIYLARRLSALAERAAFVGRLNSDLFVVLMSTKQPEQLDPIEELRLGLSRPFRLSQQIYHLDFSAGVTALDTASSLDIVLMETNIALQSAKQSGGKHCCLYSSELDLPEFSPILIEHEVRDAFSYDQFTLYFQPIWSVETQSISGFEALVRWKHPVKGLLTPDAFLPVLSQLGLMSQLDLWVIRRACMQLSNWDAKLKEKHITLSVNLSPQTLEDDRFCSELSALLKMYRLEPDRLTIEITENMVMQNIETGTQTLSKLQNLGAQIAIDDFGSGYSSLNYLSSFPSDCIKFGRSFVSEISRDDPRYDILYAMVPLCQKLGKRVVIEGIETAEQHALIESLLVDGLQGYLYSVPVSEDQAISMVESEQKMLEQAG